MIIKPYIKLKKFSELKAGDKIRFKPGEPSGYKGFSGEFSVVQTDIYSDGMKFIKIHIPEHNINDLFYSYRFELADE